MKFLSKGKRPRVTVIRKTWQSFCVFQYPVLVLLKTHDMIRGVNTLNVNYGSNFKRCRKGGRNHMKWTGWIMANKEQLIWNTNKNMDRPKEISMGKKLATGPKLWSRWQEDGGRFWSEFVAKTAVVFKLEAARVSFLLNCQTATSSNMKMHTVMDCDKVFR
jgi:hypothetical protein